MDNRYQIVLIFRERLEQLIEESGLSRSAFAKEVGMDRSTLSQILSPKNDRLPRLESLVTMARVQNVSLDWLLGMTKDRKDADRVQQLPLEIRPGLPDADERMAMWQNEVIGQKIRYVPKTLPEHLKSDDMIDFEYQKFYSITPERRIESKKEKLAYQRRPETDMEVCSSVQGLYGFVHGEGMWRELERSRRIKQTEHMIELLDELYPTFRWFLFDILNRYSSPMTIFGSLSASVFLGEFYFVFKSTEHIRLLTQHFDQLIRVAVLQPTEVSQYLQDQLRSL